MLWPVAFFRDWGLCDGADHQGYDSRHTCDDAGRFGVGGDSARFGSGATGIGPVQGAPYFGIVTLSAAVIAERLAINWSYIGGFNGILDVPPLRFGWGSWQIELYDPLLFFLVVLAAAFAAFLVLLKLERSAFGTVLRGIRDNETRAAFLGFETAEYKAVAFAVSGAVAGLAGALFAAQFSFVSPAILGFALATEVLIWVAIGGKTVLLAAFVGALAVKSVENVLSDTLGQYWLLVLGLLFVAALPRGLLAPFLHLPLPRALRRSEPLKKPVLTS